MVWKKGPRVVSARDDIVARDRRFSLEDGYNLRITGVRPADQASYTCSLDTEPLTELTHQLVVLCECCFTYRCLVTTGARFRLGELMKETYAIFLAGFHNWRLDG